MDKKYKRLVISGGGSNGFSSLGALHYLYTYNMMSEINEFIGTSVGSIICYLLAIGYAPIDIIIYLCTKQIMKNFNQIDIVSFIKGDGAYDWEIINNNLEELTREKLGKFVTLQELYDNFNKKLSVITYNKTEYKKECVSHLNYPNMPCLTALRLSSNIPLIFGRYKYMNSYYLDGAIANHFPVEYSEDEPTIALLTFIKAQDKNEETDFKIENYLLELFSAILHKNVDDSIVYANSKDNIDFISLEPTTKGLNFSITSKQILNLFSFGYRKVNDYYNNLKI